MGRGGRWEGGREKIKGERRGEERRWRKGFGPLKNFGMVPLCVAKQKKNYSSASTSHS